MPTTESPVTAVGNRILQFYSSLDHSRRHTAVLKRGLISKKAAQKAREDTWWGDEPRWYPGGTPPRLHNRVTALIDGATFFAALRQQLQEARHYVYIAGWCLTPYIPLGRDDNSTMFATRLLTLLNELAGSVTVRILLWSGSTALIEPTTSYVRKVKESVEEGTGGRVHCILDHSAHWSHCHHQKAIVIDGRVAFVGGMDLTTFTGDRWDTHDHPLRAGQNWHDAQLMVEGEAVADVEHNFRQRWEASGGQRGLPHNDSQFAESWHTPVQVLRTIPAGLYPFAPHGEFGIFHWYMSALRRARRLIYIENQYCWSPHVMNALLEAIDAPHDEPFRIVLVLPAHAGDGRWDNDKHVDALRKADRGRGIISVYSLYSHGPNRGEHPFTYSPTYVHAKVTIIDDEWLTVGSANLNNRGLITDSEINLAVHEPALAHKTRVDLWAEHLGLPASFVEKSDPVALLRDQWEFRAAENNRIIKHGEGPLFGAVHHYSAGRRISDLVLEDVQSLTFEH